jgi:ATP-binding cassette subfamily C protein
LIGLVDESKKYIAGNVIFQWIALAANIAFIITTGLVVEKVFNGTLDGSWIAIGLGVCVAVLAVRFLCNFLISRLSYLSSETVKKTLRYKIYAKLLRLGSSCYERGSTSEIVQVSVEGVEQLETYFGSYLPQFFYAMLAPVTLFAVLAFISLPAAVVLLVCVPLIPVSIIVVRRLAQKLFSRYWTQYTGLGDRFLENLQGLTTLKIFRADEMKHKEMNEEAERFRKITMKVLVAQLNSITLMDLVAFGGAALGIIIAVSQFASDEVSLAGCIIILLLSADFFIPMRQLGSFFHVAMNGVAASDKIFALLDLPDPVAKPLQMGGDFRSITCRDLHYAYDTDRVILHGLNMHIPQGAFIAVIGESGSGKSTLAGILCGRNKGYDGSINIGEAQLSEISEPSLMQNITYISHNSHLFKGTVRENLLIAKPEASDEELWRMLERMKLADFLKNEKGLDTPLSENASNLSGGQRQRLALCRALLHDSFIYVVDESTSNIDAESESDIMAELYALAGRKTVILISHRLAKMVRADMIYVIKDGTIEESGTHGQLLDKSGLYRTLWDSQQKLECYMAEGTA